MRYRNRLVIGSNAGKVTREAGAEVSACCRAASERVWLAVRDDNSNLAYSKVVELTQKSRGNLVYLRWRIGTSRHGRQELIDQYVRA